MYALLIHGSNHMSEGEKAFWAIIASFIISSLICVFLGLLIGWANKWE